MINAFEKCCSVEVRGMDDLLPFFREYSNGRFVVTQKGPLSEFLQKSVGDVLMNHRNNGELLGIEVKVEKKHTGNLFLEIWSNRCFGRQTPGWMVTLKTDYLFYYFLDQTILYVIPFKELWNWLWGSENNAPNIGKFRMVPQRENQQLNITVGMIVPIDILAKDLTVRRLQLCDGKWMSAKAIRCEANGQRLHT